MRETETVKDDQTRLMGERECVAETASSIALYSTERVGKVLVMCTPVPATSRMGKISNMLLARGSSYQTCFHIEMLVQARSGQVSLVIVLGIA